MIFCLIFYQNLGFQLFFSDAFRVNAFNTSVFRIFTGFSFWSQIEKNKGITTYKKKELRNPRVKHRMKYRKANIRHKVQVCNYY